MSEPKKSSLKNRISGRSIPEVERAALGLVARLGSARSVELNGRKFSMEALLNGAILYLLSLPEAEQERVLTLGVRRYEALLNGESDSPVLVDGGEAEPAGELIDRVKVTRYKKSSVSPKGRKNQGA